MSRMKEYSVGEFLGLNERLSPVVSRKTHPQQARVLEAARSEGGILEKIKGTTFHSSLKYKAADRPVTLIRWSSQNTASKFFMATAWDTLLKWGGGVWTAMSKARLSNGEIPSNRLFYDHLAPTTDSRYYSELNRPFDWIVYKDILYLTDGYNRPIKTNGTLLGEWGYQKFTNAASLISATEDSGGGGSLTNGDTYTYKVTLFDSIRNLEGNTSVGTVLVTTAAAGDILVYTDVVNRQLANNYDFENEFADTLRVYRTPETGGGADNFYLVGELSLRVIHDAGTVTVNDNAGVDADIIGVGTIFTAAHVGKTLRIGANQWVITVYIDHQHITIKDTNLAGYTGGDLGPEASYSIWDAFVDSDNDLTDSTGNASITSGVTLPLRLHEEDTTAAYQDHLTPERCRYCIVFGAKNNRVFMAGDGNEPNRLYYSAIDQPDYFPLENYVDLDPDDGDKITGLIKFQGRLYIFKRFSTGIMNVDGDPFEWSYTAGVLSVGAVDKFAIADCGGTLIFPDDSGIWMWDGTQLRSISHNDEGSNIIQKWEFLVKPELVNARAVYHEKRHEYWLAVTLDDERNLYDSTKAGLGNILESSTLVGVDNAGPPQNNALFVYSLRTGQWFYDPHQGATAWEVFRIVGDDLQLYRGDYGSSVFLHDITQGLDISSGDRGQATAGAATTLTDASAYRLANLWTVNEWDGATLYVRHYLDGSVESCTVASNTDRALTGEAGTFSGANPDAWQSNPVASDYYIIVLRGTSNITVRYQTPSYAFGSLSDLKAFIEMTARVFATGTVTVTWTLDQGEAPGGQFQLNLDQGDETWGTHRWGSVDSDVVLTWTAVDAIINTINFPDSAEGYTIEFEFTISTSSIFRLYYWVLGYHINTGNRWAR